MNGLPKQWWLSKTVWAGIIGGIAAAAALLTHHTITDADIQTLAGDAAAVCGMAAGVAAIIGRFKAGAPIAGTQAARTIQPQNTKGF